MSNLLVYNNVIELLVKGFISIFSGDNMGRKKNSKSVVVTIIITLIVLGCLSFAGIKYFNAGDEGTQVKIYEFAVKVFPLLVGVVLIVIASMIATSREETDDEEDKLPPNSYDQQLFEAPADDPAAKTASKVVPEEPKHDEVAPEEAEAFYSIFDAPEDIVKAEKEEVEPETEAVEEPQAEKVASQPSVVAAAAPSGLEQPLIEAIYKLVTKLDNVTDYLSYEEEDDEEDDLDDYEYYDTPQEEEEAEEEAEEEPQSYENSPLENKIDKLCDAIANLTAIVSAQALAAPAAAPAKPVEKKTEKAAPAPAPVIQRVEVPVEVPVDQEINDVDVTDPIQRARIEFDSAKDGEYDISFVYTDADVDNVLASLGGSGDAFEINGKTVAIIPFLTGAEAKDELDKLGIAYDIQTIDADAIANGDFDRDILPRL